MNTPLLRIPPLSTASRSEPPVARQRPTSYRPGAVRGSALGGALAAVLALAACGGAAEDAEVGAAGPSSASSPPAGEEAPLTPERCAQNEAAGAITYITGYQWQASAGILEEVAAEGLGYYDALCLDVSIQPGTGDTAQNASLVAAGTAQVTSVGNEAEILTARAGGSDVTGIATLGHVPIATLMTMPEITELGQLEGTVLGQKGGLPPPIRAMLVNEGVDVDAIQQVVVGYDPSILPRGQVQSLTGYKSNEPALLADAGEQVTLWNPEDYGVTGSFAAMAVNPDFLADHPTAAQDFLRATLRAFAHCQEEPQECVDLAAERDETGTYDVAHNLDVWAAEQELVASSTPAGTPVGHLDPEKTRAEAEDVVASGLLEPDPDVEAAFDDAVLAEVYDGDTLVWPVP